jgi:hypothetical protein
LKAWRSPHPHLNPDGLPGADGPQLYNNAPKKVTVLARQLVITGAGFFETGLLSFPAGIDYNSPRNIQPD